MGASRGVHRTLFGKGWVGKNDVSFAATEGKLSSGAIL